MPEMTMVVRWPDGQVQDCYSPSLVLHDHLEAGATYPVADFVSRTVYALGIASDRVREKFGFACTSAAATASQVRAIAAHHPDDALVEVLRMWPALPGSAPAGTAGSLPFSRPFPEGS